MSVLNKIGFSPAHIDETLVSALPSGPRSDRQSYTLKYEYMSENPSLQAHTHTHAHANYTRALRLVNTETELPPSRGSCPRYTGRGHPFPGPALTMPAQNTTLPWLSEQGSSSRSQNPQDWSNPGDWVLARSTASEYDRLPWTPRLPKVGSYQGSRI